MADPGYLFVGGNSNNKHARCWAKKARQSQTTGQQKKDDMKSSSKPKSASKAEMLRRQRLGDLQRLYRQRYRRNSLILTDDDAGREDLRELLLVASMAYNPERMMRITIANWAPWMDKAETAQMIDDVNRAPTYLRKPNARTLGDRLRLTDHERTTLAIQTIRPFDLTDKQLIERRKARDAERKWRKRRAAKMKPRDAWLANCKSRTRPWQRKDQSRAQWYRDEAKKRTKMRQVHETGVSAVKFNTGKDRPVSLESLESQKRKRTVEGREGVHQRHPEAPNTGRDRKTARG